MKRHKVVLYNPSAVFYTMPLALLAVGSYLDSQKYDVRIIDGRLEADAVRAVLAEIDDALCLGVTVLTGAPIRDALRVTRAVKARRPTCPVAWGGWHPSLFPEQTLVEAGIDAVVVGQGEETFADLVACWAEGAEPTGVLGCVYHSQTAYAKAPLQDGSAIRNDGRAPTPDSRQSSSLNSGPLSAAGGQSPEQRNPPRPVQDTNGFPAHNYHLIPVERYFQLKQQRQLDYISSQGCRFRCTFCADPFVYKRGWFGLEPGRMGEELEYLWQLHRFTDVGFQDETFFTSRQRVAAITEAFLRRRLAFTWMATMRADQGARLDEALLAQCKRAGLRRVMVGLESGSQQMLDWMKKDIKLEQVFASAEKCLRQGIAALFNIIVGFPDEPEASITESLRVAKQLRAMSPTFEVAIFYYKPYPGNEIAAMLVQNGYQLPCTLEEWAMFDYVGASNPWVSHHKHELVERFKFYQRIAWSRRTLLRAPVQALARWRCERDFYAWPVEKVVGEWLRPSEPLS